MITSVASGAWSNPSTWDLGRAPDATDLHVMIGTGTKINLDVSTHDIKYLSLLGDLIPDPDKHIVLRACAIVIGHDATHDYTEAHHHPQGPMPGGLIAKPTTGTFKLQFVQFPDMDPVLYPALVCSGGTLDLQGADIGPSYVNLDAASGSKGATSVTVVGDISRWKKGDRVAIMGCNNSKSNFADSPPSYRDGMVIETEEKTILDIVGQTITFDTALAHWHKGRTSTDGAFTYTTEIANLSRTVTVESADPSTTASRGHTQFYAHSKGALRYVKFHELGKEGRLGKYPIHFHHCKSTMRGFVVDGCAITNSHNKFLSIHATNYVTVRNTVGHRCYTSGFFLEDGTEVYNIFYRCLASLCLKGAKAVEGEAIDYLSGSGFGFWWVNGRNAFIDCVSTGNDRFGFFYEIGKVSRYYSTTYTTPQYLTVPMLQEDGTIVDTQVRNVRMLRFQGNLSHNEKTWAIDMRGLNHSHADPSIVKDFVAWSVHYPQSLRGTGVLFDNFKSINSNYGLDVKDNYQNGPSNSSEITFRNTFIDEATVVTSFMARAGKDVNFERLKVRKSTSWRGMVMPNHNWDVAPVIQVDGLDEDWTGGFIATDQNKAAEGRVAIFYVNDWFGAGRAAKVIHANHAATIGDGLTYGQIAGLTKVDSGTGLPVSVGAEVPNYTGNTRPNETDNLKPATAITSFGGNLNPTIDYPAGGLLTVRGFSVDKGAIAQVLVNGVQATAIKPDFSEWEAVIPVVSGPQTITAYAIDAAGNQEINAHVVNLTVVGGVSTLYPTDDAYVQDGTAAGINYGTARLVVKKSGTGYNRRSYLKFDLSGVRSCTSAKLRLSLIGLDISPMSVRVHRVDATWEEETLTWNNKPALPAALIDFSVASTDSAIEVDLTSAVKTAMGGIFSICLVSLTDEPYLALNSKETATSASLSPALVVTH